MWPKTKYVKISSQFCGAKESRASFENLRRHMATWPKQSPECVARLSSWHQKYKSLSFTSSHFMCLTPGQILKMPQKIMLVLHPMYESSQLYKAKWARADDRIHFAGPLALFIIAKYIKEWTFQKIEKHSSSDRSCTNDKIHFRSSAHTSYLSFLLHRQDFWIPKFYTQKLRKTPINYNKYPKKM